MANSIYSIRRGEIQGLITTLFSISTFLILRFGYGFEYAGGLLIITIVVATYMGGLRVGLLSAALSWLCFVITLVDSFIPLTFGQNDKQRMVATFLTYFILTVLIGIPLERVRRREEELVALNNELERRVEARALELRQTEARLQSVIQHAPIILLVLNKEGRFVLIEGQGLAVLKLDVDQLIGQSVFDVLTEQEDILEGISQALAGEEVHKTLAIDSFIFDARYTPIKNAAGEVESVVGVSTDITALMRTSAELQRSNAELERFAYVASHDLQEPIRTVTGFISVLRERYSEQLDERGRTYLELVSRGATRLRSLVEDLLVYSRLEGDTVRLHPINLEAPLKEALERLQAAVVAAGGQVTFSELPQVMGDVGQLTQVFQNLIGNAIKFHRENVPPQVHISAQQQEENWVITITDNGIGIEAAYLEKVFEMFQRLHSRERFEGTGLGLAICRKIIEHHGGSLWVESEPNKGSTFFFTLKAVE